MADASQNSKSPPTIAENEQTIDENAPTAPPKIEEPVPPQPKFRGRPKGAEDAKPRIIKRVPIERLWNRSLKWKPEKRWRSDRKRAVEEELPPPKSPRTLHRERVQEAAMERRKQARERQDAFERVLDNFMGF